MTQRITTTTRIAIGLASLTITVLLIAEYLGLVPDARQAVLDGRRALAESITIQICLAAQRDDATTMQTVLDALLIRNESVLSAAVRRKDGSVVSEVGDHAGHWVASGKQSAAGTQLSVPIYQGKERWGDVELRFAPLERGGAAMPWIGSAMRLTIFVAALAILAHMLYLKRILRYLNPASVIPDRVRKTLDALAEGVLILNDKQQIVLANKAFAEQFGQNADELQGLEPSDMRWTVPETGIAPRSLPWLDVIEQGVSRTGVMLRLAGEHHGECTVAVNAMPIFGAKGERRGVLATFDDVTMIERQNIEMSRMLQTLKDSRDEIQKQNRDLHLLATVDPLTACLNRRSFFERLESHWTAACRYGEPLSFVMVDIDHFKAINDRYGHATGDTVLKKVGETLRSCARECDVVCRFGGEEFCILFPKLDIEGAALAAERYRATVEAMRFDDSELTITASLGVATCEPDIRSFQELLERADKALYQAKRAGRNRVIRSDEVSEDLPQVISHSRTAADDRSVAANGRQPALAGSIPFHVVTALTAALAYRDTRTAEHSRQVSELCVATAKGLMSQHDCYLLEVAALLHDIGKLAIPDAILLKPGKLTPDEWKVMRAHDAIGAEILDSAFICPKLTDIVRLHHAWFAGNPNDATLPQGDDIPLGAKILSIADAFSAMVSDRPYRRACVREDAFEELRRYAGVQFDPELVERFIETVSASDQTRSCPAPTVSRQTALKIGLQIERVTIALDTKDFTQISAMANDLAATAEDECVPDIAGLATKLEHSATVDRDLIHVVQLTNELLELCRSTQHAYLELNEEFLQAKQNTRESISV